MGCAGSGHPCVGSHRHPYEMMRPYGAVTASVAHSWRWSARDQVADGVTAPYVPARRIDTAAVRPAGLGPGPREWSVRRQRLGGRRVGDADLEPEVLPERLDV